MRKENYILVQQDFCDGRDFLWTGLGWTGAAAYDMFVIASVFLKALTFTILCFFSLKINKFIRLCLRQILPRYCRS